MNSSHVDSETCDNLQSRTFDDIRCDSGTELGRNLQMTAANCTIMAEKLLKKGVIKRSRKCNSDPCESNMEGACQHASELEIFELKTEIAKLHKIIETYKASPTFKDSNSERHSEHFMEQEEKILVLRAENLKLKQLLKDVTEVNKRWQKYNQERQDHLQRLLETIHEQHKQPISHLLFNTEIPAKERRQHKIAVGCRHSDSQLEHMGEQSAIQQRYENAVKEICQLKKQLEESRQIQEAILHQLDLTRNEKKDQFLILEMQTKAFKEDWEAEKQEKLVALEKVNKLTKERHEAISELETCKQKLKQLEKTPTESCSPDQSNFWKRFKPTVPFSNSSTMNNFAFNLKERNGTHITNISSGILVADDVNQSRRSLSAPSSWEPIIIDEINKCSLSDDDKNELECPGCKKSFSKSRHLEFLDHFEECQATSQIH